MRSKTRRTNHFRPSLALALLGLALSLPGAWAEDWTRLQSKDGKISALFPTEIRKNVQTQTDRTLAGKAESKFGEYYGDGILLAGSATDLPRLAAAAKPGMILSSSKKTFLEQAKGKEISFKSTTVQGAPARELAYKGDGYQGKGAPYRGRALFILLNKRVYILNAVTTKESSSAKAAENKLFGSIRVAK